MRIFIEKDFEKMSQLAKEIVFSKMTEDRRVNLSLTGGSTPKRFYELLVDEIKDRGTQLDHVHYYPFDETIVLDKNNRVVGYDNFDALYQNFFKPANIDDQHIHRMKENQYADFAEKIEEAGGLDLMLFGMGEDGHFNANMPGSVQYDQKVYAVDLTKEYPWNTPYQESLGADQHADEMYTLGLPSLLKVKHAVLIVNGEHKAEAIDRAINGPIDPNFPSSYLRLHPNLTILMDAPASKKL